MHSTLLPSFFLFLLSAPSLGEEVSRENLEKHVRTLASKEYGGRSGPGARKAEAYIVAAFKKAGLETSVQPFNFGRFFGRNVIGIRKAGKEPAAEHIILSAHYDHLGEKDGAIHPGASDNAAGVAVLLELTRLVKATPKRDILFIAFDQEEVGLLGSYRYVEKPARPLDECAAFATFDILGRDFLDSTRGVLFVAGLERSDTLFPAIKALAAPKKLHRVYIGTDAIGNRSDYVSFRDKRIPYVFFTTGESLDYHRPTDTADKLDYEKLHREGRLIAAAAKAILAADRPKFLDKPACRVEEVATIEPVLEQLLANRKKLGLDDGTVMMGQTFQNYLKQIVASGKLERHQRREVVNNLKRLKERLSRMRR